MERTRLPRRTALLLAAALTSFVLLVSGALAWQISQASGTALGTAGSDDAVDPTASAESEADDREQHYRDLLEQANGQLQQDQDQLQALQTELERLRGQNATLLERETTYQQRLADAAQLVGQIGSAPAPAADEVSTNAVVASPPPPPPVAPVPPRPVQAASSRIEPEPVVESGPAPVAAQTAPTPTPRPAFTMTASPPHTWCGLVECPSGAQPGLPATPKPQPTTAPTPAPPAPTARPATKQEHDRREHD